MSKLFKISFFSLLFFCIGNAVFAQEIKLKWLSFEEMQAAQQKQAKKVLVIVSADWSDWCKTLEKETLGQIKIAAYLNKNYYLVNFKPEDAEIVKFKGKTYDIKKYKYTNSDKTRKVNALAVELIDVDFIFPSLIFLNEKLDKISVFKGYKNAKDIDPILSFFASNSYLKQKWSAYSKTYKSIL